MFTIKYLPICIVLFLVACDNSTAPASKELINTNNTTSSDSIKKKETHTFQAINPQTFPQGFWIGKSYYDSLQNGNLTSLFIENHLKTYIANNQGQLEIGNAYGIQNGTVSMVNGHYYFQPAYPQKKADYFFDIKEDNHSFLLSTNFYWGAQYVDELNQDTMYIKVSDNIDDNNQDGFYQLEFPIELLYFSGNYEVLDKKTNQVYPNVKIENHSIQNFINGTNYPFDYESFFSGSHVVYIALEEKYGRTYELNSSERTYYLPSERKYFVVEDTEKGFQLFQLLQPSLNNPNGCVEAHDIESEAEKGELLFVFSKKL